MQAQASRARLAAMFTIAQRSGVDRHGVFTRMEIRSMATRPSAVDLLSRGASAGHIDPNLPRHALAKGFMMTAWIATRIA